MARRRDSSRRRANFEPQRNLLAKAAARDQLLERARRAAAAAAPYEAVTLAPDTASRSMVKGSILNPMPSLADALRQ